MRRKVTVIIWVIIAHCILSMILLKPQSEDDVRKHFRMESSRGDDDRWWQGKMVTTRPDHPYLGARHPSGEAQMLVNPSVERLKPSNPPRYEATTCPESSGMHGIEGRGGAEVLSKVRRGITRFQESMTKRRRSRILCMVYTVHTPKNVDNLRSLVDTWARQCDGFIAASNYTDHSAGSVDLLHRGNETYKAMWQKLRSMWAYAYEYRDSYDFFHVAGDDVYVAVDNLRSYLDESKEVKRLEEGFLDVIANNTWFREPTDYKNSTLKYRYKKPSRPLFFGCAVMHMKTFKVNETYTYNLRTMWPAGGPGYTLNSAAVELFYKNMDDYHDHLVVPQEDVLMGSVMSRLGVPVSVTIDETHGSRYVGSAQHQSTVNSSLPGPHSPLQMRSNFDLYAGDGVDSVSETAIAFHLKDDNAWLEANNVTVANLMRRYNAVLYNQCER